MDLFKMVTENESHRETFLTSRPSLPSAQVCQSSWVLMLYRDEVIKIHSFVTSFFESVKGYRKKVRSRRRVKGRYRAKACRAKARRRAKGRCRAKARHRAPVS